MLRSLAIPDDDELGELVELGQAANRFASQSVFEDYRLRKSANTIRRHNANLAVFADFLRSAGVKVGSLAEDPQSWKGVTWGLVAGFQRHLLKSGYALGSANLMISTIKTYASLAAKAGALPVEESVMIRGVEGFAYKERRRIDQKRAAVDLPTRRSSKKEQAVSITPEQADQLKAQPDTPKGRRDALIMCLLLDHGLRVSEVAALKKQDFDLNNKILSFYRPKTDTIGIHKLAGDTLQAAKNYLNRDADPLEPGSAPLFKGHQGAAMSDRTVNNRVGELGKLVGLEGLSPHDLRHYCATRYAKTKPLSWLLDWFGWTSPAMALRYIERAQVVDAGD